jgi:membrane protein DedA with SNARE-associated domain
MDYIIDLSDFCPALQRPLIPITTAHARYALWRAPHHPSKRMAVWLVCSGYPHRTWPASNPVGGVYLLGSFASTISAFVRHWGGPGQFVLGVLDSSFLVMPLGNDLLMVVLTVRDHRLMPYYASMATAGSVVGVVLVDALVRRGGEKGLQKYVPAKRLEYIKRKVTDRAWLALTLASVVPPPFPFTPFVIAASALQYPRKKLLAVIGVWRMVRFTLEGILAIYFGRSILSWVKNPFLWYGVIGLVVVSVAASVFSVYHWVKLSHKKAASSR